MPTDENQPRHPDENLKKRSLTLATVILQTCTGMVVFQGLTFLSAILLTRTLSPGEFGQFQLLTSLVIFSAMVAKMGMDEAVSYLLPQYGSEELGKTRTLICYALAFSLVLGTAFGCVFWLGARFLETRVFGIQGFSSGLRMLIWLIPVTMLMLMGNAILRGLGCLTLRNISYYLCVSCSFLVALLILSKSNLTLHEAYLARLISFGLGALIPLLFLVRRFGFRVTKLNFEEVRGWHRFSGCLAFVCVFQFVIEQPFLDLILVGRFCSDHEAGLYAVGARIASLVALASNAAIIATAAPFAKSVRHTERSELQHHYARSSVLLGKLSLFIGLLIILLHDQILAVFGANYSEAGIILLVLVVGQLLVGMLGVNSSALIASGHARVELLLTAVFGAVMIGAGILFGKLAGSSGVALATTMAVTGLSLCRGIYCWRRLQLRLPGEIGSVVIKGLIAFTAGFMFKTYCALAPLYGGIGTLVIFAGIFALLNLSDWKSRALPTVIQRAKVEI